MHSTFLFLSLVSTALAAVNAPWPPFPPPPPPPQSRIRCIGSKALAPEQDCRDVLEAISRVVLENPYADIPRFWGQNIQPTPNTGGVPKPIRFPYDNGTHFHLAYSFVLDLVHPDPGRHRNECEIHLDNDVGREDEVGIFDFRDLVVAGRLVLDICYRSGHSGLGFPVQGGSVYVTPLRKKKFGDAEAGDVTAQGDGEEVLTAIDSGGENGDVNFKTLRRRMRRR